MMNNTYFDPDEMRCGLYIISFEQREEALKFIARFKACPNWPILTTGPNENEVFVLALELKRQQHGDFSEDNNPLVKAPSMIGARKASFIRIDNFQKLFGSYVFKTAYAAKPPCGADCNTCPLFQSPCQGCPAVFQL